MSANSAAFDHVNGFRWRLGDPTLADAEAHLYDLGVLRSVLEEAVEIAVADARADGVTWARIAPAPCWSSAAPFASSAAQVQYDGSRYCVSPMLVGLFSCLATATTPVAGGVEGRRGGAAPK